jgi:hypothetical protein
MKRLLLCLALLFAAPAGAQPLTVIELFTSQGCNSCPPADALLGELAARPDVLALSLHVDYWNRLGWPDPFSAAWITARQRAYARTFGAGSIYTPQAVANGRAHAVGSDRRAVEDMIRRQRIGAITAQVSPGRAVLAVTAAPATAASLVAVDYSARETTAIQRGENAGRSLTYHHVVRRIVPVADWPAAALTLEADLPPLAPGLQRALLLQAGSEGAILAAVLLP